jgi:hypothetical protein
MRLEHKNRFSAGVAVCVRKPASAEARAASANAYGRVDRPGFYLCLATIDV